MASYNKSTSINSDGKLAVVGASDTLTFPGDITFSSGKTVTFTGASIVGLSGGSTVTDGTGSFGFLGSAGALSSSAVTTVTIAGGTNSAVALSSTGTGTLAIRSATGAWTGGDGTGYFTYNGSGALSTTGTTTVDLDCSGALQINSSGGIISIGNDAVNQAINIATGGTRTLSVGGTGVTHVYTVKTSQAAAYKVTDGTTDYLTLNTSAKVMAVAATMSYAEGTNAATISQGISKTAGATLAVGDVLCYAATTGKMVKADANGASAYMQYPVGVALMASTDTNPVVVGSVDGMEQPVTFASAPAAASIGLPVYLSETAGQGTMTAPSTPGVDVYQLGILAFADGVDTTCRVLWRPQYRYTV